MAIALLSNLLLFPLQAAELGMVSAYYTYIFTNLVRHFTAHCLGMESVLNWGWGAQYEAQEVKTGK